MSTNKELLEEIANLQARIKELKEQQIKEYGISLKVYSELCDLQCDIENRVEAMEAILPSARCLIASWGSHE